MRCPKCGKLLFSFIDKINYSPVGTTEFKYYCKGCSESNGDAK